MSKTQRRRRRAYGEGSVYQRESDGRWYAALIVGELPNGKPDRRYVSGETEKEAAEKLDELKDLRRRNMLPLPSKITVREYSEDWLEEAARVRGRRGEGLAENTVSAYRNALKYLNEKHGDMLLRDLTGRDLSDLYLDMRDAGLSVRQREIVHKVTGQVLRSAIKERIIVADVSKDVANVPRSEPGDPRPLTHSEVDALLRETTSTKWKALFQLAIDAALGRGEVLGLTWHHINLHTRVLSVEQQVLRRKEARGLVVHRLKTKDRRRYPTLSEPTIELLRAWHRELQELLGESEIPARAFIFPGGHWRRPEPLRPMSPESVQEAFVRSCELAGIEGATFHDLRATAATWMAEAGVPPKTAARRLGHSDVSTMFEFYTRVQERSENMAADVMGALFGSNSNSSFD